MSNYIYQTCDCSGVEQPNNPNYIRAKEGPDKPTLNKIIHNQVRYESSLYTNNIATLHVLEKCCDDTPKTSNNQSDRIKPAVQRKSNYSRGPKLRPGMLNPGGSGVDVKHNSYDRYLARKKGKHLVNNSNSNTIKFSSKVPV